MKPIGPVTEDNQDLVVADLLCRGSMEWNVNSYVWLASRSGLYSAKSGYYAATTKDEHTPTANQILYKTIWNSKVSPKLQLFLWKIVHGTIAIGENLAKRGLLANITCQHCGELETTEHIFLHCNFTRQLSPPPVCRTDKPPTVGSNMKLVPLDLLGNLDSEKLPDLQKQRYSTCGNPRKIH
ncbi:hypothetical protein F2Q68_00006611 [Brassica cretica]|uniref:Reverse transcriptase zinc-binding domain-containing protein n=1 Tax=Brassica cretica TaxID=69181 RepID=A0A8S9JJP9_BRACR|nr:hypothetical protein F2Q68_00006611 [Brassica cretica]